ncbi:MAG: hypothetical protein M5U29_09770, partial [Anaerolineae bacterium]|nr:hypothetical protein [Anaerolineae bacterium]
TMLRRMAFLALAAAFVLALSGAPAAAQGGDATTTYTLNMRAGPGGTYAVLVTLPGGTPLLLEARNADASWVLGRTLDGAQRGWLSSLYLSFSPGVSAIRLPFSEEIVPAPRARARPGGERARSPSSRRGHSHHSLPDERAQRAGHQPQHADHAARWHTAGARSAQRRCILGAGAYAR